MDKKLNNLVGWEDFKSNWKPQVAKPTKRTETGLDIVKEQKINEISRGLVHRTADALSKKGHTQRSRAVRDYVSPGELNSPYFRFIWKKQYIEAKFNEVDVYMFIDNWIDGEGGPAPLAFTFRDKYGTELSAFWIVINGDGTYILDKDYSDDENYPEGRLMLFSDRKEAVNFTRFVKSEQFIDYLNKEFNKAIEHYKNDDTILEIKEEVIVALSRLKVNDFYRE